MAAHHDKHCCCPNATLSKVHGSLRLQSVCRDILPVCSQLWIDRSAAVSAMQPPWPSELH